MNVISMKPLSLAEARTYVKVGEEKKPTEDYFKKFCKISLEDAKKLEEELQKLGNIKIKEDYLIKLADILPRDAESVQKIFHDVSLDEQEIQAILDIVKNY